MSNITMHCGPHRPQRVAPRYPGCPCCQPYGAVWVVPYWQTIRSSFSYTCPQDSKTFIWNDITTAPTDVKLRVRLPAEEEEV